MNNIISCKNVVKRFGSHTALNSVNVDVPEGKIYGLLGPNGAGKTTLIRIINHITVPDSGEVVFNGHPLTSKDVLDIGYLPEERGLYKKMKVGEQAIYLARLKGMSRNDAMEELKKWAGKIPAHLSKLILWKFYGLADAFSPNSWVHAAQASGEEATMRPSDKEKANSPPHQSR